MTADDTIIILIAPNVGEQMGGEAIKALQIFRALKEFHPDAIQITHERCRAEIADRLRLEHVYFVKDTAISLVLWRTVVLRNLLDYWFSRKAVELAESLAGDRKAIIHQTEPNSPVSLRAFSKRHVNVLGPINGNIYYPEMFRSHETLRARMRRILHMPLQALNRILFRGMPRADLILSAGGERTERSLYKRGCRPAQIKSTLDCGISKGLLARPRIRHEGRNMHFVHFGRLVFHKGTSLIIKSLPKTRHPIKLDVIGRGPELERCKRLANDLGVGHRVTFLDWYESHPALLDSLDRYRGVVLPSIEDANGIVVQESMALGLPPICLDWGGPQLLVRNNVSGYLVEPKSEDYVTSHLARSMDAIAEDGALAESMSKAGRETAAGWVWEDVMRDWLAAYSTVSAKRDRQPVPA
jgi:alpha-maltose-1-phosphate synthase